VLGLASTRADVETAFREDVAEGELECGVGAVLDESVLAEDGILTLSAMIVACEALLSPFAGLSGETGWAAGPAYSLTH